MRQSQDQKRFTISELATDWHELMIPQSAAHNAANHRLRQRTTGPAICSKQTYHRLNQPQ